MTLLSSENFRRIKRFVLQAGDRQTYCNRYNHNPHYSFGEGFEVYLNPDVGQRNINCDPARSDFDEIVIQIQPPRGVTLYYHLKENPKTGGLEISRHGTGGPPDVRQVVTRYVESMLERILRESGR